MPKKTYTIAISDEEKAILLKTVTTGKSTAKEILHANILLATADNRIPKLTVAEVADRCNTTRTTVQTVRKSYLKKALTGNL